MIRSILDKTLKYTTAFAKMRAHFLQLYSVSYFMHVSSVLN